MDDYDRLRVEMAARFASTWLRLIADDVSDKRPKEVSVAIRLANSSGIEQADDLLKRLGVKRETN